MERGGRRLGALLLVCRFLSSGLQGKQEGCFQSATWRAAVIESALDQCCTQIIRWSRNAHCSKLYQVLFLCAVPFSTLFCNTYKLSNFLICRSLFSQSQIY